MTDDRVIRTLLGLCTAILVFAGLYSARSILAPVAFSFFIIAIVWPFQRQLQARIPKLLALAGRIVLDVAAARVDFGPQVAHPQTRTILPLLAASYTTIFNAKWHPMSTTTWIF
jgi:hypothetical protein